MISPQSGAATHGALSAGLMGPWYILLGQLEEPVAFVQAFLTSRYFPASGIPFSAMMDGVFFSPIVDNRDYPIHGPNVIRLTRALVDGNLDAPGLIKVRDSGDDVKAVYLSYFPAVMDALEARLERRGDDKRERVRELLMVAALYHDIGKSIRRANHPQIGANLLRNFDETQRKLLVDGLALPSEPSSSDSKDNRFSLISSIIQHHDKFGVVSTGEGGLPIFSDILYFSSSPDAIAGIKKNVTSVMLMNLADIAAVNIAPAPLRNEAAQLAAEVSRIRSSAQTNALAVDATEVEGSASASERDALEALAAVVEKQECCLGLSPDKISNVLSDWRILVEAIQDNQVRGNRVALKLQLLQAERNPARAIRRILRLLHEASSVVGGFTLQEYMSPTTVESVLVGTLGAHQFQSFCEQFANVAKLDYGLAFFKTIMCACIRLALGGTSVESDPSSGLLRPEESAALGDLPSKQKSILSDQLTILFVRVLESLVGRYAGVLDYSNAHPRRFGFQMRDLTLDAKIRESIVRLLCVEEQKEPIALTWIADEVTIWSMD